VLSPNGIKIMKGTKEECEYPLSGASAVPIKSGGRDISCISINSQLSFYLISSRLRMISHIINAVSANCNL